ncbi:MULTISPECIES: SDR family NAD(P)-dependent oxidoreductase [Pseudomonas]|jgi:NAD(P)-dependent dehydrogenase (short-subunit alcohol dehydrogenase family)|uniref:SDR family oxidoreductase n=1 Tax=Pseudomonas psychrophila TaxID=122355 RepID=A0A8I1FW28_9PSED|nr:MULTISPECIES: SDR family oxidoreductase [Pseudomonas]KAB0491725.1 SDR family oxidoreductase [Pseudomonas psychrophila]KMN00831.1 short-chain dehydrogenase [Pseudomonas psychrophila]KOX66934.1 short-chain dehydrogenase [Pseudomonas psychrophila]MBJ2258011.1 SDR family oxidoreductase [Pseudomonas psychrophila]MDY7581042.1 SDR family oxidoreductase [Pseudomonas sp. CCI3.1]
MNKVAFITGASRGIGRETALAFARAGFDLAISARSLEEGENHTHGLRNPDGTALPGSLNATAAAIRELGRKALVVRMDLLDSESVLAASQAVFAEYGRVDVLVNNAIYQGSDLNAPFMELQPETLERVFQGYMMTPFLLTRAVVSQMLEQGGGVVINVTSGAGETDPPVAAGKGGWGYAYGAGKAAVSRLSGILSVEFGDQGIRAYTLNPGVVTTDALRATIGDKGVIALRAGSAPPEVPAAVMLWLATNEAAVDHQRKTIQCQPFAREHGIVEDWR